ncbi:MAG: hypothetical protein KDK91_31820, partial [Gammaproteobacteria bacterium]|nr:hypothetical protein [Gammaproteobacteria bacterium]
VGLLAGLLAGRPAAALAGALGTGRTVSAGALRGVTVAGPVAVGFDWSFDWSRAGFADSLTDGAAAIVAADDALAELASPAVVPRVAPSAGSALAPTRGDAACSRTWQALTSSRLSSAIARTPTLARSAGAVRRAPGPDAAGRRGRSALDV